MHTHQSRRFVRFTALACGTALVAASCQSDQSSDAGEVGTTLESEGARSTAEADVDEGTTDTSTAVASDSVVEAGSSGGAATCDATAALFVTRGSANADLDEPEVAAECEGDAIVVTSNAIPDYTYIGTSPGSPSAQDYTFTIPATPVLAESATDVPLLGTAAITLGGVPIFGPTEGTGGDVDSLPGILSECGSHNGPTGFHIHKIMTSENTDCLFTPDEVASAPQLVGYAFDGFPIYTGNDQYTSSWQLTDETLFATDTWAAHTYVEGSGDLDECNGLTDSNGDYAYYTTDTFPYVVGCYVGVVDVAAAGGGGGGGDRPARPEPPTRDDEAGVQP